MSLIKGNQTLYHSFCVLSRLYFLSYYAGYKQPCVTTRASCFTDEKCSSHNLKNSAAHSPNSARWNFDFHIWTKYRQVSTPPTTQPISHCFPLSLRIVSSPCASAIRSGVHSGSGSGSGTRLLSGLTANVRGVPSGALAMRRPMGRLVVISCVCTLKYSGKGAGGGHAPLFLFSFVGSSGRAGTPDLPTTLLGTSAMSNPLWSFTDPRCSQ